MSDSANPESEWRVPALATAHSHAFQRGMRGRAQRRGKVSSHTNSGAASSNETASWDFWSWREAMYELAGGITPESAYAIARVAYRELYQNGVRTVGEFHYLHHQPDGAPYEERTILSRATIRAALDEGLRIGLMRVIYGRGGLDAAGTALPISPRQKRFCDARLDDALTDVESLQAAYRNNDRVRIGIAPHSVRAVGVDWLQQVATFAQSRNMMLHMHLAEQTAEIDACVAATGRRPVELVADLGLLDERFVAVHATHLGAGEAQLLGQAGAMVCLCPTTERDLGDGLPNVSDFLTHNVELCVGVDSHVLTQPLEELRGVELGERLRTRRRLVLERGDESLATWLWRVGSRNSERASGFESAAAPILLNGKAPELALVAPDNRLDAAVFSGTARLFDVVS